MEKLTEYEVQPTQVVHNLTEWIEKCNEMQVAGRGYLFLCIIAYVL